MKGFPDVIRSSISSPLGLLPTIPRYLDMRSRNISCVCIKSPEGFNR